MMAWFDWFGKRQEVVIDETLWGDLVSRLPFVDLLTVDEKKRLKSKCQEFLATKQFSAAGGLDLTDEICTLIAIQACLPILNLGLGAYRDWVGIVVYPNEFVVQRQFEDENGVVHEFEDVLSGESWDGGPVLVSWQDVRQAGEGYNVVIHEFAHKLDMLNGEPDGIPALHSGLTPEAWDEIFLPAFEAFCELVDQGIETSIDPYGSEDHAEFFAVISESFFERPELLHQDFPALYGLLCRYYLQDPLTRLTKAASADKTAAS